VRGAQAEPPPQPPKPPQLHRGGANAQHSLGAPISRGEGRAYA